MNIKTYLNTTKKEVESKKFNIFIGISLGNKLFTKEVIKEYISWALQYSKEKVVVLIADKIQSINYEIRNNYSKNRAYSVALRRGNEIENQINSIKNSFPSSEKNKIEILHWGEIEKNQEYQQRKNILLEAFRENKHFHKLIIGVVKENINPKTIKLENHYFDRLAMYVLLELPILIAGFQFNGIYYNLIPYPGIGKIDYLSIDLAKGKTFRSLTKKLNINQKVAILEAYPNSIKKEKNEENIYIKETKFKGKSIFAKSGFKKGEIVFVIEGPIVRKPSIYTIPIDYNIFIDPLPMAGKELCHSCEPNCGIKDKIKVVAMKNIKKDEEVTIDYAMIVYDYGDEITPENRICKCGSKKCRGKLGTYKDLLEKLKKKYKGFISEYLTKEMI